MSLNHYVDNWPPGTLTREKMIAYRDMNASGWIILKRIQVSESTGAHKVLYASELDRNALNHEFKKTLDKILNTQRGADAL